MINTKIANAMLAAAMVTVGSTVVVSKIIGSSLLQFTAATIRFAVALPVLLLLIRVTQTRMKFPDKHDALLLILQAAAGSAGFTAALIYGATRTSAADAGIILGTLPAVAALTSWILLRETERPSMVLAIVLATAGWRPWVSSRASAVREALSSAIC